MRVDVGAPSIILILLGVLMEEVTYTRASPLARLQPRALSSPTYGRAPYVSPEGQLKPQVYSYNVASVGIHYVQV